MKTATHNNTAKNILYAAAGLSGITLVILIHELGHFLFAYYFNVPIPLFSVGFGPPLCSFLIGKTMFQLALLPLGGYVEIDPIALAQQAYIPKMFIIFGGIFFNFIFSYIVLLCYAITNQFSLTPIISTITPHSPAEHSGLQPADRIIACNHQPVATNPHLIATTIQSLPNKALLMTIERHGIQHNISIILDHKHPFLPSSTGWLGITLEKKKIKLSLFKSLKKGHAQLATTLKNMHSALGNIITKKDRQNVFLGPIGIISMIGKSLAINAQLYWFILAIISLNIGFLNLLPLPFFDGGKALLYTIEALTGSTIPTNLIWIVSSLFLALFVFFMAMVTTNDIKQLCKK
jgi:regulator of sigma E protease